MGHGASSYLRDLQMAKIWVTPLSNNWVTVLPVIMLVGSLEFDNDSVAQQELSERAELARADPMSVPPFFVSWCQVGMSSGRSATMAKCVMAYAKDMEFFHQLFSTMLTTVARTWYLVSRDYSFSPILFPPTD